MTLLRLQLSAARLRYSKFDDVLREKHSESKYDYCTLFQHKVITKVSSMNFHILNKTAEQTKKSIISPEWDLHLKRMISINS